MVNGNVYIPTPAEREATLARGEFLKVSGDGVFATLQGEGVNAGEPVVFLRLQECNLHCGRGGEGWKCDTWYTWDRTTPEYWRESSNKPVGQIAGEISAAWDAAHSDKPEKPKRLVVSGGEPLLQQGKLIELFAELPDFMVEIETNGTVVPRDELAGVQFNCSPKLASSGNELRARFRPKALSKIASFPNSWFKFVVANEETDMPEIQRIVGEVGIDPSRVMLMSEGSNAERLTRSDERLQTIAAALGYGMTRRNHIFWFGDKRRT